MSDVPSSKFASLAPTNQPVILPPFIKSATPIVCNSEDATILNAPLNSKVRFQLEETLTLEDPEHERFAVQVTMASIPYSFYDIDEASNEIHITAIALGDITPTTRIVVITPGNYAATKLAEEVERLANTTFGHPSSGPGKVFEVFYTRASNKMNVQTLDLSVFVLDMRPLNSCRKPMGFSVNVFGPSTGIQSDQMVYMQGSHQYLHLMSDMVAFHGYAGNFRYKTNLLQSMRVASPPFSIITFENRELMMHNPVSSDSISSFEILIQDVDGRPVNFRSMHWSIELSIMVVVKSQIVGEEHRRLNRDARYSAYLHSLRLSMQPDGEIRGEGDETADGEIRPATPGADDDEEDGAEEGETGIYDDRGTTPADADASGDPEISNVDGIEGVNPADFVDREFAGGDAEALRFMNE
jgi:hypothetical protein